VGRHYSFAGAQLYYRAAIAGDGKLLLKQRRRPKRRTPVDRYLAVSPLVALIVGVLVFLYIRSRCWWPCPILMLWAFVR